MKRFKLFIIVLILPLILLGGIQYNDAMGLYKKTIWDNPNYMSSNGKTITSISTAANTLTSKIVKNTQGTGALWVKVVADSAVDSTMNVAVNMKINRGNVWVTYSLGTITSNGDSVEVALKDSTWWATNLAHQYQYEMIETGAQSNEYQIYEWKTVDGRY